MKIIYQDKNNIAEFVLLKLTAMSNLKKNNIHVVLSGGQTPKYIFKYILKNSNKYNINWSKFHFWWSDERYVNITDNRSNYGEAKRIFFDKININDGNIHNIIIKNSPYETAVFYKKLIKKNIITKNNLPCFDWIWLGMGHDGHTASIFSKDIKINKSEWIEVSEHPINKDIRITISMAIINNTKDIDILVTGINKALMIEKIMNEDNIAIKYPAQCIRKKNNVIWHIDKLAASYL